MKAKIDQDGCIGCGVCESTCPEVFEMRDGVAHVKIDPVPPEAEDTCKDARDSCPVSVITIEK